MQRASTVLYFLLPSIASLCSFSFVYDPCGNAVPAQWFPEGDTSLSNKIWHLIPVADDAYTSCFKEASTTAPEDHPGVASTVLDVPDDSSVEVTPVL